MRKFLISLLSLFFLSSTYVFAWINDQDGNKELHWFFPSTWVNTGYMYHGAYVFYWGLETKNDHTGPSACLKSVDGFSKCRSDNSSLSYPSDYEDSDFYYPFFVDNGDYVCGAVRFVRPKGRSAPYSYNIVICSNGKRYYYGHGTSTTSLHWTFVDNNLVLRYYNTSYSSYVYYGIDLLKTDIRSYPTSGDNDDCFRLPNDERYCSPTTWYSPIIKGWFKRIGGYLFNFKYGYRVIGDDYLGNTYHNVYAGDYVVGLNDFIFSGVLFNSNLLKTIGDNLSGTTYEVDGYWYDNNHYLTGLDDIPAVAGYKLGENYLFLDYQDGELYVYFGTGQDWYVEPYIKQSSNVVEYSLSNSLGGGDDNVDGSSDSSSNSNLPVCSSIFDWSGSVELSLSGGDVGWDYCGYDGDKIGCRSPDGRINGQDYYAIYSIPSDYSGYLLDSYSVPDDGAFVSSYEIKLRFNDGDGNYTGIVVVPDVDGSCSDSSNVSSSLSVPNYGVSIEDLSGENFFDKLSDYLSCPSEFASQASGLSFFIGTPRINLGLFSIPSIGYHFDSISCLYGAYLYGQVETSSLHNSFYQDDFSGSLAQSTLNRVDKEKTSKARFTLVAFILLLEFLGLYYLFNLIFR